MCTYTYVCFLYNGTFGETVQKKKTRFNLEVLAKRIYMIIGSVWIFVGQWVYRSNLDV